MKRLFVGVGDIATQYAALTTDSQLSPASVVLAWNAVQDVVPILLSPDPQDVVKKLEAGGVQLTAEECTRIERFRNHDSDR